jgi:hypothetical protein
MMRQKCFTGKKPMNPFATIRHFRAGALPIFDKSALIDKGRTSYTSRCAADCQGISADLQRMERH